MAGSRPDAPKPGAPFGKSEPRRPEPEIRDPGRPHDDDTGAGRGSGGADRKINVGSGDRPTTPKPGRGR